MRFDLLLMTKNPQEKGNGFEREPDSKQGFEGLLRSSSQLRKLGELAAKEAAFVRPVVPHGGSQLVQTPVLRLIVRSEPKLRVPATLNSELTQFTYHLPVRREAEGNGLYAGHRSPDRMRRLYQTISMPSRNLGQRHRLGHTPRRGPTERQRHRMLQRRSIQEFCYAVWRNRQRGSMVQVAFNSIPATLEFSYIGKLRKHHSVASNATHVCFWPIASVGPMQRFVWNCV
ncbi:hypothetical protein ACVWZZ_003338 [Bradyrhizobium sp. LM6.10]